MSELKLELEPWIDDELNLHAMLWINDTIDVNSQPVPLLKALESVIDGQKVGWEKTVRKEHMKPLLKVAKRLHKIADQFEKKARGKC